MSARYAPLPDLNYIPTPERIELSAENNKQAQGIVPLKDHAVEDFLQTLHGSYQLSESDYKDSLNDGIPKELARLLLPVGRYSRMRVSANLRNWIGFITLRADPKAQWEIQQYALVVADLLKNNFPQTYSLYESQK